MLRQMRGDRAELRAWSPSYASCASATGSATTGSGGWCSTAGAAAGRRASTWPAGIANLVADGALARRPYWLSLLADLLDQSGDRDGARRTLDEADADARTRDDVWWLPEVLRMRAAYDERDAAVVRLQEAADLAADQGSLTLLDRCERDLAALGVAGVRPSS
jgi:hypothetical protein